MLRNSAPTAMQPADWLMIVLWLVGTSAVGVYFQRYVKTARDYLLAGRRLRWWQIAVAQSADAVDATDFVAVTGQGFRTGASQIGYAWWGMGIGSLLLSRYIVPLLYRTGVYTNAEFLRLRYGESLRIASAVLQVLYRFVAMALVVFAMAKVFEVVVGFGHWTSIWTAMGLTLIYVFTSGQLGVVMAAVPQVLLMLAVSVFISLSAAWEVGSWQGLTAGLPQTEGLLHLAGHSEPGVPGGVYLWGLILTLVTYPIVNQTVAQRIVAARSESDARRGTVAALVPWYVITGGSVAVGIIAVVLLPELAAGRAEEVFPILMQRYLPPGLLGLGVAAVMLASMSTAAGIGTAIAGLVAVDVLKTVHRRDESGTGHLLQTRLVAAAAILGGTCFAMLIPLFGGMIPFYVSLTGTFILPLVVPYVGAALYPRASRGSGMAALAAGVGLGVVLFLGDAQGFLVPLWCHPQWRPFWVLGVSALVFVLWSIVENRLRGPLSKSDPAGVLNAFDLGKSATPEEVRQMIQTGPFSELVDPENLEGDTLGIPRTTPWHRHPGTWEVAVATLLIVLMIWWW